MAGFAAVPTAAVPAASATSPTTAATAVRNGSGGAACERQSEDCRTCDLERNSWYAFHFDIPFVVGWRPTATEFVSPHPRGPCARRLRECFVRQRGNHCTCALRMN
ncbi:exported hypothetical protein [Burkholderiales bacterium]|nr:exported hypothetical protein [Burkholderiales bacterium]